MNTENRKNEKMLAKATISYELIRIKQAVLRFIRSFMWDLCHPGVTE